MPSHNTGRERETERMTKTERYILALACAMRNTNPVEHYYKHDDWYLAEDLAEAGADLFLTDAEMRAIRQAPALEQSMAYGKTYVIRLTKAGWKKAEELLAQVYDFDDPPVESPWDCAAYAVRNT